MPTAGSLDLPSCAPPGDARKEVEPGTPRTPDAALAADAALAGVAALCERPTTTHLRHPEARVSAGRGLERRATAQAGALLTEACRQGQPGGWHARARAESTSALERGGACASSASVGPARTSPVGGAPGSRLALQSAPPGQRVSTKASRRVDAGSRACEVREPDGALRSRRGDAAPRHEDLTCRRLRHAGAEHRHGGPRHEGGARAASPARLGPRASGAPAARRQRRACAPHDSNGRAKNLWWVVVVVVVALTPDYLRLAPQNLGKYYMVRAAQASPESGVL